MCCIQLPSRLTSFRSTSVKPYFWSKDNYDVKLDELEAPTEPDELEVLAELDKLEVLLPTLEAL